MPLLLYYNYNIIFDVSKIWISSLASRCLAYVIPGFFIVLFLRVLCWLVYLLSDSMSEEPMLMMVLIVLQGLTIGGSLLSFEVTWEDAIMCPWRSPPTSLHLEV